MRRQDVTPSNSSRVKSLVAIRTSQQQQRKSTMSRSMLPRSYSSPSHESEYVSPTDNKGYVMRSFSSPDSKEYKKNTDSFYRPKSHGSRSELDSDLEGFEQFEPEEGLIDIDADNGDSVGQYRSSPERDEPKRVMTTLLPGSGLHRVCLRPVTPSTSQMIQSTRESMKKQYKNDGKGTTATRLNFQPLVVTMPSLHVISDVDPLSSGVEELQCSPHIEEETSELYRELDNAEEQLDEGAAIATEESDADTIKEHGETELDKKNCKIKFVPMPFVKRI